MIIRKLRLDKGYSQEQLAEMAGISTRTLQRIERGANASPETLKCLAAVLEVDFSALRKEQPMTTENANSDQPQTTPPRLSDEERAAMVYVRDIKAFYTHALAYACVVAFLVAINVILYPGRINVIWPMLAWGIGLAIHGLSVFEVFTFLGDDWERKQIRKRLKRK